MGRKKRLPSIIENAVHPQCLSDLRPNNHSADNNLLDGCLLEDMQSEEIWTDGAGVDDGQLVGETADNGPIDDEQLIHKCVELWKSHERQDLEVRFSLGKLLNDKFGHPKDRQEYGRRVFDRLSDETDLSVSDLNLMRWFAALGKTVAEIREKYPEINNWTAFKQALPELKANNGFKCRNTECKKEKSGFRTTMRYLDNTKFKFRTF